MPSIVLAVEGIKSPNGIVTEEVNTTKKRSLEITKEDDVHVRENERCTSNPIQEVEAPVLKKARTDEPSCAEQGKGETTSIDKNATSSSESAPIQSKTTGTETAVEEPGSPLEVIDVAQSLNLEPGARIQVRWDIDYEDERTKAMKHEMKWWSATLLPHDGRLTTLEDPDTSTTPEEASSQIQIPVRVIDYDPYPERGFHKQSLEEVGFLSNHSLLNLDTLTRTCWRTEGDAWQESNQESDLVRTPQEACVVMGLPPGLAEGNRSEHGDGDTISVASASQEDALRTVVNTVLQTALVKSGVEIKLKTMDAGMQAQMATKIANAKEQLIEKLLKVTGEVKVGESALNVVTPEHIKICMEQLGQELQSI